MKMQVLVNSDSTVDDIYEIIDNVPHGTEMQEGQILVDILNYNDCLNTHDGKPVWNGNKFEPTGNPRPVIQPEPTEMEKMQAQIDQLILLQLGR